MEMLGSENLAVQGGNSRDCAEGVGKKGHWEGLEDTVFASQQFTSSGGKTRHGGWQHLPHLAPLNSANELGFPQDQIRGVCAGTSACMSVLPAKRAP